MSWLPARRLLLVHAHPDDESINNGVTMARYAAEGVHVALVTCTLGEEGEVIPPSLGHLATDRRSAPPPSSDGFPLTPLGRHRWGELAAALAELGVGDHRLLGGVGRYRDSGMMGAATNDHPDCFWRADVQQAATSLLAVVRELRPQVLVTYDPDGGYGHPDHIQAHRVAMRAAELAAEPAYRPDLGGPHTVDRIYWNCVARSPLEDRLAQLRSAGEGSPFRAVATVDDVPGVVPDASVSVAVTGDAAQSAAKVAAMRAHATQIVAHGVSFALSNDLGQPVLTTEHYRLASPTASPAASGAPSDDLFAGVAS